MCIRDRVLIDQKAAALGNILQRIADTDNLPALIHCTAGKDRTGVITALALGAIGVPDLTIIADYALTARYIQPLLDDLRQQAQARGVPSVPYEKILESRPETMKATLDYLDTTYGGVCNYLEMIGVSGNQISQLQQILVEPG